ncbi:MAG: hypothetical protein ACP5PS_02465 [Bacteroidales bacterium]
MDNESIQQWLNNKLGRFNRFWLGFASGIVVPLLTLLVTYHLNFEHYNLKEFYAFLLQFRILTKLLSLCVLPNLGIFFLFLYPDFRRAAMGTLTATFALAIIIIGLQAILGLL